MAYSKEFDYDGSGNLIYFGRAQESSPTSKACWEIQKLTYDGSGNLLTMLYANGEPTFKNIWDNRVVLSYS